MQSAVDNKQNGELMGYFVWKELDRMYSLTW